MTSKGVRDRCLYFCMLVVITSRFNWKHASGKSTQKALIFMPYKNAPKFSLNRPRLSLSSWRCMKLASKSAILSLSSAKAGSSDARGKSAAEREASRPLGVDCEARRLVREGGRRGVVGREGTRVRECEEVRWWVCARGVAVVAIVLYVDVYGYIAFTNI